MVPERPKMRMRARPTTKGGVMMGRIEKMRIRPRNRDVARTAYRAKTKPSTVVETPTAAASTIELRSTRPKPADVTISTKRNGVKAPLASTRTLIRMVEIGNRMKRMTSPAMSRIEPVMKASPCT